MKLKKLLALILAFIMAVCVFSACDKKEKTETSLDDAAELKKLEKEEGAVKEVVTEFNELWIAADSECMNYLTEDCEDRSMVESYVEVTQSELDDVKEVFDTTMLYIPEDRKAELQTVYEDYEKEYMESYRSTEIGDIIVNDENNATVYVTIKQMGNEPMAGDVIMERAEAEAGVTLDSLLNADTDTRATGIISLLDTYCDMYLQAVHVKVKTVDAIYKLKKVDDKWLIASIKEEITPNSFK